MNDGTQERLGDAGEFELLEQLGRWVREHEAQAEADAGEGGPDFEPFPEDRAQALIDRALQAQDESKRPIGELLEPAANDRPRALGSIATLAVTAAAIVATFVIATPRTEPSRASAERELSEGITAPEPGSEASVPKFVSMRIDGGGPLPQHQGPKGPDGPDSPPRICQDRPMQLSLAVAKEQHIELAPRLELSLEAKPPWGPSHRFVYDVARDDRWRWVDEGRALVFSGTLEQLAPLTPGRWSLQLSAGAPGACSLREPGSGCSPMKAKTIDVVATEACDVPR